MRAAAAGAPGDAYGALVRAIVGQQLSTKAARSIFERLVAYFGGHTPTPARAPRRGPRGDAGAAGLSRAKVAFLRDLAEHVEDGELRLDRARGAARRGGGRAADRGQGTRARGPSTCS